MYTSDPLQRQLDVNQWAWPSIRVEFFNCKVESEGYAV